MTPETDPLQPDKIFDHHRQQLSAMMDGALAPDQARFLLRRLQHDSDLTACWERWQLCGDVLRGHADALLPRDFAQRVAAAVFAEATPNHPAAADSRPRWVRWGGGALAASFAVAALLVLRQGPNADADIAPDAGRVVLATSATPAVPQPAAAPPTAAATRQASTRQQATSSLNGAIARTDAPRRNASRRSRGQSQRSASRNAARAVETPTAVAANASAPATTVFAPVAHADAAGTADPFALGSVAPGRTWPRAVLPNASASGGFTVGLGSSVATPSFYPFEPQMPAAGTDAGATRDGRARNDDNASSDVVADDPTPPR